jgi:hypothetical protein
MPTPGSPKNAVISVGEVGGWSVSRRDVAHLMFDWVTNPVQWEKRFKDRQIRIEMIEREDPSKFRLGSGHGGWNYDCLGGDSAGGTPHSGKPFGR